MKPSSKPIDGELPKRDGKSRGAARKKNGGTSRGAMVMHRAHLAITAFAQQRGRMRSHAEEHTGGGDGIAEGIGTDWACVSQRFRGVDIVKGAVYLTSDSAGLRCHDNQMKMQQIETFLRLRDQAFILGG